MEGRRGEVDVRLGLLGRPSKCKLNFLAAAAAPSDTALNPEETREGSVRWVSSSLPKQGELSQTSPCGFSPGGERLLPATLAHVTATELSDQLISLILVVEIGSLLRNTKVWPDPCPILAALDRARERLCFPIPIAVAASIDVHDHLPLNPSLAIERLNATKAKLSCQKVPLVPVSPYTELWLHEQEREGGRISYHRGATTFRVRPGFEQVMNRREVKRAEVAFEICQGTGIMRALSAAVGLRPPSFVFPVGDFTTLQSLGWQGAQPAPLQDCLLVTPTSTVRHLVAVEVDRGILSGDLVIAEILPAAPRGAATGGPEPWVLDPDTPIGEGTWIMRLETTVKPRSIWKESQRGDGRRAKPLPGVKFGDLRNKDRRRER